MAPPSDLWDRLGWLHGCCDVTVSSATRDDGTGTLFTTWTVVIRRRGSTVTIEAEAPTMISALIEGLHEAEARAWHQQSRV
jgi:hypothetical protein